MPGTLTSRLRDEARRIGFDLVGVAPIRDSDHTELYRWWLERGLHGSMAYLGRPDAVEARTRPGDAWPELRSALVVGHFYAPQAGEPPDSEAAADPIGGGADPAAAPFHRAADPAVETSDPARGVIARYARGRDYHKVVRKKLVVLLRWLESEVGRELPAARAYVDTGPVLERELARRAGLGWFGRNTMLIHPRRGSWFFLGSLLLPLELDADEPFERDHCGTCSACLDACPTGALLGRTPEGAPIMDATRCISYLTIENRGPIPRELRPAIGNRIYGCDICQEVCPFNNERFVQVTGEWDYRPDWRGAQHRPEAPGDLPGTESPSLVELMRMTRKEWDLWTRGSAIRRVGYAGFKRNVAVAIGNWLASIDQSPEEAVAVLHEALEEDSELVREHAIWALERAGERDDVMSRPSGPESARSGPGYARARRCSRRR